MHDIGSSRPTGWGPGYNEFEQELSAEAAGETAQEFEGEGEFETEFEVGESEFENEFEGEVSGEMQEMELAAELLAVSNEQEMEQFLGGLIKSVGRAATNFAKSSAGKALGGILRSAAKSALPIVGSALGNFVVPGAGGLIGGKLASMAGSALGLELEGLSNEDREFEVARRLVRIGQHATQHLASMPAHVPPARAARIAFLRAARQVAPGLVPAMRAISRNGIAAARQAPVAIFGAPARRYPGQRYAPGAYYDGAATASAYEGSAPAASAPCPNCGTHTQVAMPHSGQWRRSRNGRAIILYLGPRRTAY
ncbi:hypothetical protein AWB73_02944 [Caballeronia turbans]|jgi:hypothetical protein|uniref:hypothetical protein n=1 Tax=unclassified Caballeronia TaxID=2646786 RepID=UPI00074C478E|nr:MULTISPECIES: hypothetical protein [unclassified Caballeronia]SAL32740.1 hypothetical protein AWB73_02944 [Caballeronia turbans]